MQVRHRLAALVANGEQFDVAAHRLKQLDDAGARFIDADAGDRHVRPRHDQRRDQRERRRRRVARHKNMLGPQLRLAANRYDARAFGILLDGQVRAEAAQHPLAMVAGRFRLDHAGDARGVEPGEQHRRFHLRRGHRQAIFDRHGGHEPAHGQRQAPPRTGREFRAHAGERLHHPPHRPLRQRGVARKGRRQIMACQQTHQQTRRGAAIAHFERDARLEQAAHAHALDMPDALAIPLDPRAHSAQRGGGREHILALQQPLDPAFAHRQRGEHQRAVRDALVPRNRDGARKPAGGRPEGHRSALVVGGG